MANDVEQRVKKIVAEQLGVNEAETRTNPPSSTIWALIRSIPWSW